MKYFFFFLTLLISSCADQDKPENLIPPPQMAKVLTEVHLLDAKIESIRIYPVDSAQRIYDHYESLLFENLGITKTQYEESFDYYLEHPADFEKVYGVVVDSLLQIEKTAN